MDAITPLPFDSSLRAYEEQAEELPGNHLADARSTVARSYGFADWQSLTEYVQAVTQKDSPLWRYEWAVEAVIKGDAATLDHLLREDPTLIRARSTRVTPNDPPMHRATLLHYVAANGVEDYRQKTPPNAVEIATLLLQAGADPDALAGMYGADQTILCMLVSSAPPAEAGLQIALAEILLDFGAAPSSLALMTALAHGYSEAAQALVRRGAPVEALSAAAGLGLLDRAARLLAAAGSDDRHRAFALAAQHGHVEIVRMLLDAGEDPNRYNPKGNHHHATPLHQAAWSSHLDVVRLLVERGARLDLEDTIHHGTPLGWALHGDRKEIAEYLRNAESVSPTL